MSKRIVIDPITRIEGHLRVDVVVDENNVVQDAYVSSTLWRGLEVIAKGRDPKDLPFLIQRICGVCTYAHYLAATKAVEDALGVEPPLNAKLVRSLMKQALFIHDHVVHFYHLHGFDWFDITKALEADPKKASQEAFKYTENPIAAGEDRLKEVQQKVAKFAKNPQGLGPFANAYWGHRSYRLTPEQHLIALSHYFEALKVQRVVAQMMAIFGGKNPHPQSVTVGGVTCVMDLLDPARLAEFMSKFKEVAEFVKRAYRADILMIASMYKDEPSVTARSKVRNYIAYESILLNRNEHLLSKGIIFNGDLSRVHEINEDLITEEATHSWYRSTKPEHPYDGTTDPQYTGFVDGDSVGSDGELVHTKVIDPKGKYSWIKSPRYDKKPMETGPLASILVSYASNNERVKSVVDRFLQDSSMALDELENTLGRTIARMLQAEAIAEYGLEAFDTLVENLKFDEETYTPFVIEKHKEYKGRGIFEVPRGMLSHWVRIKNGVCENYQAVVPSTWNAGPMDAQGIKGPYEADLVGLKIDDLTKPLEVIRVIHSFDPCIACAVHVMDMKGAELGKYKVDPLYGGCSV